ncbi:MAG: hypothetical protein AABZ64_10020, partial [Nitrospinota bacterium]
MAGKPQPNLLRRLKALGLTEDDLKSLAELLEQGATPADLAAHIQRAEESSRLKTLFLQLVSRELGGPAEELRKQVEEMTQEPDPWKLREGLKELLETVHHLHRTVRNLIDTATIEAGAVQLRQESVDLASLVSGLISRRLQRLRGYRIQPEMPSGALRARLDRERITLLVDDLLDAAIHLSPEGGTILVRLAREGGEVRLAAENRSADLPEGRLGS